MNDQFRTAWPAPAQGKPSSGAPSQAPQTSKSQSCAAAVGNAVAGLVANVAAAIKR